MKCYMCGREISREELSFSIDSQIYICEKCDEQIDEIMFVRGEENVKKGQPIRV